MLHLKRASAGSGKTYELAKTYIKLLLSIKESNKKRRLRNVGSIQETLQSILAVTFTVKATAEMKQRIVERLADLSRVDTLSEEEAAKVPYLEDFMKECHLTSKDQLAYLAKDALRILLFHFSDFKVQTIDSFFQGILHTFAYEASLDENFNMEIDTDYVTSVGFDAALDSISSSAGKASDRETLYWLRKMIKSEGKAASHWNVFAKSEGSKSLYSQLISEAKNLEKEDFQTKRREIADYFQRLDRPFREVVNEVDEANMAPWKQLHERRKNAALELMATLRKYHLSAADLYRKPESSLKNSLKEFNIADLQKLKVPRLPDEIKGNNFLSSDGKTNFKRLLAEHPEMNVTNLNDLGSAFKDWVDATRDYVDAYADPEKRLRLDTWIAYREMLPQLMVVLEISRRKKEYLEATNTLEISDTTHILSRIIGEDETPFVYERLGNRLNHFLIDEFQDTSHMQWSNLKPLLLESESREMDNLIIGDAKQSIYRFRNADYRLITTEVKKVFPDLVPYTSDAPPKDWRRENTNFRSDAKIVKFNNFIFSRLLDVEKEEGVPLFNDEIHAIYEGAEQFIPDENLEKNIGYADIVVYPSVSSEEKEEAEKVSFISLAEPGLKSLPEKIMELKDRGYDYKDIGVLVKTGLQGQAVIKMLSLYNSQHPKAQIPVISEENLLVDSSLSVKVIISALEIALKGTRSRKNEDSVLPEPIDEEKLFALLASLQSQSLTSIVEAVADKFLTPERRNSDAPFIAAFQDAVLDYCASHTSDIGSFLKWWKRKAKTLTINSPEDSDGVKVYTIHGSKGLEFGCVILPRLDIKFVPSPQFKEWRWVVPSEVVAKADLLPPFLPVETRESLANTVHAGIWEAYCNEVALDEINKLYVGFTRAVHELYAYCPVNSRENMTAAGVLTRLLESGEIETSAGGKEEIEVIAPVEGLGEDSIEFRYGEPLTQEEIKEVKKKNAKDVEILSSYKVYSDRRLLRFQESNNLLKDVADDSSDGDEEADPRAEGTLKHRIMQLIERPGDLSKALLAMKTAGLAPASQIKKWGVELSEALKSVESYGWFADDVRVLNERTLLRKGSQYLRPDRIITTPEGQATVIDYKFGAPRPKHRDQIKEYADRLTATGRFRKVNAFLWYVSQGKVEKVL